MLFRSGPVVGAAPASGPDVGMPKAELAPVPGPAAEFVEDGLDAAGAAPPLDVPVDSWASAPEKQMATAPDRNRQNRIEIIRRSAPSALAQVGSNDLPECHASGQSLKANWPRRRERVAGIEPAWPVWKTGTLPLSYTRGRRAKYACARGFGKRVLRT